MSDKKMNVAVIGLGFGAEFLPIYQKHPLVDQIAICQRNPEQLDKIGDAFKIEKRYQSFDEVLSDPEIDAVHINTPVPIHGEQSIAALKAGKHVACTVPMATSIEECREIVELVEETGKTYMMMETVLYSREFLYVKELVENDQMGKLQFLRGSHQQDMTGWPGYWEGLPPMHYATHCVAPCTSLAKRPAEYVTCLGSGTIQEELIAKYGSPFAIETCHIKYKDSDLAAEVTRSLFDTARQYRESFDVYGSKKSFEWNLVENDKPIIHTGEKPESVSVPDFAEHLPEEIRAFTKQGVYDSDENQHLSFTQGAGHGGSHPHLVNEFIKALIDERPAYPNAKQAANITCTGILAHESAMAGGEIKRLPDWTM